MSEYMDLTKWARRDVFEFFRSFDKPYFNVCTNLDITKLLELLRAHKEISITLTYHYFAMRLANEIQEFRYRLRKDQVLVHDVIHGGTTVLMPNEVFSFAYFDYQRDFLKFHAGAKRAVNEISSGDRKFLSRDDHDALIHFTTLPWISFTSFSHARNWGREDSVPKIAFGRFIKETNRVLLPISVEVHHALMDGIHVGRFLNGFEEELREPNSWLELE